MDFQWAENYPEVHKICTLFSLEELSNPSRHSYKSLQPFLQDGPQCGLVALAIYLGNPSKDSVNSIFERAKSKNYTNSGEMFSAESMANLAKNYVEPEQVELYTGTLESDYIKSILLSSKPASCVLVPYDSDKDHSPCLQSGHKAHWCVICGAAETPSGFYVLARHGKARNVAIWKLADLARSNLQLNEVGVYNKDPDIVFRVPEGGIQGALGLKGKAVILWGL